MEYKATEVCYFRFDQPPGYVNFEGPAKYIPIVIISFSPAVVNTIISVVLFTICIGTIESLPEDFFEWGIVIITGWGGVVAAQMALPSEQDIREVWEATLSRTWRPLSIIGFASFRLWNPLALLGLPFILLFYILVQLRKYGSRIVFAICVAILSVFLWDIGLTDSLLETLSLV